MKSVHNKLKLTSVFIIILISISAFSAFSLTLHAQTSSVDLIWESPQSQVPPNYKGKALHSGLGRIQVVALPRITNDDGVFLKKENLRYEWEYNSLFHESDSGIGENVFEATAGSGQNIIQVRIINPDNDETLAVDSVNIPVFSPELLTYRHDQDTGTVWQQAIDDRINTKEGSATITAYPYYLPQNVSNAELLYEWSINGGLITRRENRLTVRKGDNRKENKITVSVKKPAGFLPNLSSSFDLVFE